MVKVMGVILGISFALGYDVENKGVVINERVQ